MNERLIKLFHDMSELTAPECAKNCRAPHSCCAPEYCDIAENFAAELGVTLEPTNHPTLKFMGPTGCVVPPHLRPVCTVHTCAIGSYGFKPDDLDWTQRYFTIREEIDIEILRMM